MRNTLNYQGFSAGLELPLSAISLLMELLLLSIGINTIINMRSLKKSSYCMLLICNCCCYTLSKCSCEKDKRNLDCIMFGEFLDSQTGIFAESQVRRFADFQSPWPTFWQIIPCGNLRILRICESVITRTCESVNLRVRETFQFWKIL